MYRKIEVEGFGQVEFYGNAGAMGQFEDEMNVSLSELASSGKLGVNAMYSLLYWTHYVSCKRLKKPLVMDRDDMKANISGKQMMELAPLLIQDILKDLGVSETEAKKK